MAAAESDSSHDVVEIATPGAPAVPDFGFKDSALELLSFAPTTCSIATNEGAIALFVSKDSHGDGKVDTGHGELVCFNSDADGGEAALKASMEKGGSRREFASLDELDDSDALVLACGPLADMARASQLIGRLERESVDINAVRIQGAQLSPLEMACRCGRDKIALWLVDTMGCSVAASGNPVLWAAYAGRLSLMQELKVRKADTTSPNVHGETPLHYAAARGHIECCKWLVADEGSDPAVVDSHGLSPVAHAVQSGRIGLKVVTYFKSIGVEPAEGGSVALSSSCEQCGVTKERLLVRLAARRSFAGRC